MTNSAAVYGAQLVALVALIEHTDEGERILLGRKLRGFGRGNIVLPGGKVEPGEQVIHAAVREFREETGLVLASENLELAAQINFRFSALESADMDCAAFVARSATGSLVTTEELEPLWVDSRSLPTEHMWQDAEHWLPLLVAGEMFTATIVIDADHVSVKSIDIQSLGQ